MGKRRQRFYNWCKKDPDDERKINYTCHFGDEVDQFTSEDTKPYWVMEWLRNEAMIDNLELIDNEWYVELSERK